LFLDGGARYLHAEQQQAVLASAYHSSS